MKSIILLCAIAILATNAFGQNSTIKSNVKEGVMKKAGKVWVVKPMQEQEVMSNGLLVKPNGIVKTAQGKTITLNNGDCIGVEGKVVGLNQKDVTSALIRNGKMWVVVKLEEPLALSDGSFILPDGVVKKNGNTLTVLKNNEIVDVASRKTATWKPADVMALNK